MIGKDKNTIGLKNQNKKTTFKCSNNIKNDVDEKKYLVSEISFLSKKLNQQNSINTISSKKKFSPQIFSHMWF